MDMFGRLFIQRHLNELWKSGRLALCLLNKTQAIRTRPALSICYSNRLFSAGSPQKRENVDLDKWKSVMRSQASSAEQDDAQDEEEHDEEENIPEGLEAARELVAMWRLAGKLVPQEMSDDELKIVADLTTKSARKKYLKYLAMREMHKRARKEKNQKKKAEREAALEQQRAQNPDGEQNEIKNTLFLQFWSRSLDRLLAWRNAQAMLYDQPLVFDMSYESNMSRRELENTVTQLMEVEAWNRRAKEPFHLHFCNLHPDGAYKRELLKRYGAETWDRLLITDTHAHPIDLFPRDRLVYLTADSPNILRTFDPSKVYIVGGLVDRSILPGLSLANAKRLKLATARLPLDEFLHWEMGAKNLTLDQMIRIMISIKETGKWEEALKFVPTRKHDGFHRDQQEITNRVPGEDGDKFSKHASPKTKTLRSGYQGSFKSKGQFGSAGFNQEAGPTQNRAASRVRPSLKNSLEEKRQRQSKVWRDDD
ncbi:tRNA methyltransferase 10 homolog C [Syngnathus scovelli]|uniref:tRNA methyltransferase 10 homolog C n=1 Tax=Syngnathus scovelli TaxID=161590 RepID=UPI0021109DE3|nr:tRNA methyltransferase 10 homolog C [Syngnathus scovelli]